MGKGRLEAFSDGVIAVIITIMVLEMKVPHGADAAALAPMIPIFLTYLLSFVFVAIYWNNHHHMFHAVHHVTGVAVVGHGGPGDLKDGIGQSVEVRDAPVRLRARRGWLRDAAGLRCGQERRVGGGGPGEPSSRTIPRDRRFETRCPCFGT